VELGPFAEFGIIILLAAILGILATKLKQPPVLGYILTGLIIGPLTPFFSPGSSSVELLSKVGITLLLFTLGLELNISELKRIGKVSLATGLGQIIFTSIVGYFIAIILGFSPIASVYIALGLTFSSTIIIVKLLSGKNKTETLYGKISVGFLIVQDFVAIGILIILSAIKNVGGEDYISIISSFSTSLLKGLVAIAVVYAFTKYVLNPVLNSLRLEKEVMFLTVLGWALALAAIFGSSYMGFTIEVGGLIAGIALSNRYEQLQLESWTKPLRDFFLTLFFVILGANIHIESVGNVIIPSLIFSVFVLIGNPIIVMIIMGFMGYTKKTSFLTSLSVAQISEFSLILINFAYQDLKILNNETLTIMTIVGGITMSISSYMIYYNEELYEKLSKYLGIFEFKKYLKEDISDDTYKAKHEIILFGCHRMGRSLLKLVPKEKDNVLIIDFDPRNVRELKSKGYNAIYADMADVEMYKHFNLDKSSVIISTVPSLKDNKILLGYIAGLKEKPVIIITASYGDEAKKLYDNGADFVIYPHLISSELIMEIIKKKSLPKRIIQARMRQMDNLETMI